MKVLLSVLAVALALAGCGGGESATTEEFSQKRTEELLGPEIVPPPGPPPKELVIKDLEEGSGPVAKPGDRAGINYVTVFYKSGEPVERWWVSEKPVALRVAAPHYRRAFERGIEGMREGGRREIIEPGRFVSTGQTVIHVIQLTSLEPAADSTPGG